MKNQKDIDSSLSDIKKALQTKKEQPNSNTEDSDYYLLENLVQKGNKSHSFHKKKDVSKSQDNKLEKKNLKKSSLFKKAKNNKIRDIQSKKTKNKNNPIENVIDNEIKPIIESWIKKNLREFVKKVVVDEFKLISKTAFKQKSSIK